ncbi:hypothetical protein [Streptomyces sp. NPDC057582]|uniref:hypothetical protein n=1 Tax=Streptomyces sp. NPDC057582 TaxID=3346174 RepID=UPI0036CE5E50
MNPFLTPFILEDPAGLTERAKIFLSRRARRGAIAWSDDREEVLAEYIESFGEGGVEFWERLHFLRMRYGGLSYESAGWASEGTVNFQPFAELDPDDGVPMVSLVDSSLLPVGVFVAPDDSIHYFGERGNDSRFLKAFDNVNSLIESAAMYWECESWISVATGGPEGVADVMSRAEALNFVDEPSGSHEWWWEEGGVRVHVWRTCAELFNDESTIRWNVWARDRGQVSAALKFAII